MKFKLLINTDVAKINGNFKFKSQKPVIYPADNVKMPTIVGILIFMSRINLMLSWVEHEKSFITSGPVLLVSLTVKVKVPPIIIYFLLNIVWHIYIKS